MPEDVGIIQFNISYITKLNFYGSKCRAVHVRNKGEKSF